MEERVYHGNIDPIALADYLVSTFGQYEDMAAQKMGQGDHLMVQVGRMSGWSGKVRGAIGISISRFSDGIRVSIGQSNWMDLTNGHVATMLIGALFFPPLMIFPLMRGIQGYALYQDIWNTIEEYCAEQSAAPGSTTTSHAIYCHTCGAVNSENAKQCSFCGTPFQASQAESAALYTPPTTAKEPAALYTPSMTAKEPATLYTPPTPAQEPASPAPYYVPSQVTCPRCGVVVPMAKYCGNCGSALPEQPQPA